MYIHCLGLNHNTAEVSLRERLAFREETIKAALARLGCGSGTQPDGVSEMVILSTCNRVEIYAVAPQAAFPALENFLAEVQGTPVDSFRRQVYRLGNQEAVKHLLRVAAGLDSLILGEPQVLGQVMHAFELARGQNVAGPVLSRLFHTALRAGKRARTDTAIGHNPASVSSVAVRLAEQVVPDLSAARVLVIGAGEMAELAVEALRIRGASELEVLNRTLARADELAKRWGAKAATFERLQEALSAADIVITSTGAPHTVLAEELVSAAMAPRQQRPLVIVDIAVPRDVDPGAGQLPGVRLYDIDDLQARLERSLTERAREVPRVEKILEEMQAEFSQYLQLLDVFPLIAEMHQRAEAIRMMELEKTLRRLPSLGEAERNHLAAMSQALVNKLLHAPITRLKSAAGGPEAAVYAAAARELFALEEIHSTAGQD
jgi:glutamyl-tRNA reductase